MTDAKHTGDKGKVIAPDMDFDAWSEAWLAIARERGHVLKEDKDFGGVNLFVTSSGMHNGPGCVNCGWTECMHCDWKAENIPVCPALTKAGATHA